MNIELFPANMPYESKRQLIEDFSFEITKAIIKIKNNDDVSYLNYNKTCLFDTYTYIWYIIYSLLTLRDYSEYKRKTYNMILEESRETVCNILDLPTENTKRVLKSRFAFYENLFEQKQNAPLGEKIQCVSEEFSLILQMDIVVGTIQSYGNDSPIYVTDYEMLSATQLEIRRLSDIIMIDIFSNTKKDKDNTSAKKHRRLCGTPDLKSGNNSKAVKRNIRKTQKVKKEMSSEQKEYRFCSTICFLLVFVFLLSALGMPSAFYIFMRWIVFLCSICLALIYYSEEQPDENYHIFALTIGVIILWNPIIPIYNDKTMWVILDIFAAIFMFYSGIRNHRHKKY